MFSRSRARSSMIGDARKTSRRLTMVTVVPNLARKIASSMAESPPPITAIRLSLKKAASQVAQKETPRPPSSSSPGTPILRCSAPMDRITVRARCSSSSIQTR